jgi:hypothetical protein
MAESRTDREAAIASQIGSMSPREFELLVFELVKELPLRDGEGLPERLAAPDEGADIVSRGSRGRGTCVWQAKHHVKGIKWNECKKSLVRAADFWKPTTITFVFATDVSARSEKSWMRLVKAGRARGITVERWTLTHLLSRLADLEALRIRLFGEDGQAMSEKLDRAIKAGHPLETFKDIAVPAKVIADFADTHGFYELTVTARSPGGQAPRFEYLPLLSVEFAGERGKVQVDAWLRSGMTLGDLSSRLDEVENSDLRMEMIRTLASGEDFECSAGALTKALPGPAAELIESDEESVRVLASEKFPLRFELRLGDEMKGAGTVPAYRIPARTPISYGVGVCLGNLLIELNLVHLVEGETRRLAVRVDFDLVHGGRPGAIAVAEGFLRNWYEGASLQFFHDELFPVELQMRCAPAVAEKADLAGLWSNRKICEMAMRVEEALEVELTFPEEPEPEDLKTLAAINQALEQGEGTLRIHTGRGRHAKAELPEVEKSLRDIAPRRTPLEYELFGRPLSIGLMEWKHPGYRFGSVNPGPDGMVDIELIPLAGLADYKLVERWKGPRVFEQVKLARTIPLPKHENFI